MFRKIRYEVETNKIFEDFFYVSPLQYFIKFPFYHFPGQQRVINNPGEKKILEAIVNFLRPVRTI